MDTNQADLNMTDVASQQLKVQKDTELPLSISSIFSLGTTVLPAISTETYLGQNKPKEENKTLLCYFCNCS